MSMINELDCSVDDLSKLIDKFDNEKIKGLTDFEHMQVFNALKYLDMYQKIGTIAKLIELKQNADKSDKHYNGGWNSCEDRLPEDDDICVLVQVSGKHKNITFENAFELATYEKEEGWILEIYPDWKNPNIIAWQPLPEPYLPEPQRS